MSGSAVPVVIDLAWSGTGDLTRTQSANRTTYPGYKLRSRANGDLRYAAVAGSVAVGTLSLPVAPGTGWGTLKTARAAPSPSSADAASHETITTQENLTMRRNMSLICVAAALGLALLPSAARAVTAVVYQFQNHSATASFSGSDATGCIRTVVDVSIYQSRTQAPPGPPLPGAFLSIYVYSYDSCRQVWVLDADGASPMDPSAFEFGGGGGLHSAKAKAAITLHDYVSNGPVPLSLDLVWTGDGDVYRGALHSNSRFPQYSMLSRSMGSTREARAAGAVLVGGTNVVTGGSDVADITWNQYGTVTRIH